MSAAGRALFAHSFVIVSGTHPHVCHPAKAIWRLGSRPMYTPVRAGHDFALCIKNRSGRRRCIGGAFAGQVSVLLRAVL
jgi:hypothetical protein